ncbi:Amino acid permease/ SLC12A domain containing protein [Elaphomyces granulatus]
MERPLSSQVTPSIRNSNLKQTLYGFQIFVGLSFTRLSIIFIVLSAVIGSGIFHNNAQALELAGPAGMILSVVVIGIVAICVNECIAELAQQFPVYNPIVKYVRVFVDKDLGWIIGIAYWYTFALVFAVQNINAAILSGYWGLDQTWQSLAFYFLAPVSILVLNLLGVFHYGIVETVGGFLKLCLVLGASILLYITGFKLLVNIGGSRSPINDGFKNDKDFASNPSKATCFAIALVASSFQGVEAIAVTAFEARDVSALRWPSKWIAYVVFLLYLLCTIGEALNVTWDNNSLPYIYGSSVPPPNIPPPTIIVFTTLAAGYQSLAGFLNGCLIFNILSASNTSLYISSRTLYGITREITDTDRHLSLVVPRTGVPVAALLFSALSFFWLPLLPLNQGFTLDLIEIASVSASVACLIVWSALCLAFIRYEWWVRKCSDELVTHPQYRRGSDHYKPSTFLDWFQPVPAWVGLVGCVLVFGFASTTWWDNRVTLAKFVIAYGVHIVLFILFVFLKLINKRLFKPWGVKLDPDVRILVAQLDGLNPKKLDKAKPSFGVHLGRLLHPGHEARSNRNREDSAADISDRQYVGFYGL